jgi:pantoate--beta-alanine ligase
MGAPRKIVSPDEMRRFCAEARTAGRTIGFVPTMGALHEGHLSLLRRAREDNALAVASVFVNPTQFGPGEDFSRYPRQVEQDLVLCGSAGIDAVFVPEAEDMYRSGAVTFVEPGPVSGHLEGMSRPGHFRGVCTVVAKLFNIVGPDRAYFGQKDAQQAAVLCRMVLDLDFGVEVVVCPTVREPDGLAMSSRNRYLKPEEREAALSLYGALQKAQQMVSEGAEMATEVAAAMAEEIIANPLCDLDYAAVVDPDTFEDISRLNRPALAAVAAVVGRTRLIDNLLLAPETSRRARPAGTGRGTG